MKKMWVEAKPPSHEKLPEKLFILVPGLLDFLGRY
jgi:hypothetical protein